MARFPELPDLMQRMVEAHQNGAPEEELEALLQELENMLEAQGVSLRDFRAVLEFLS
jgi:hypothetical protein